jgi:hypothetical protein
MKKDSKQPEPWWAEPYLWLVVGLPLSAVLACIVTGLYIYSGSQAVISEERMPQAQTLAQELRSAQEGSLPAVQGRNHSASGGVRHAKP